MSLKTITLIFGLIAWWSILIPINIRFSKHQKPLKGLHWFTAFLVFSFLFDSVFSTMGLFKMRNLHLMHVYTPVEFFLLYRFAMCQLDQPPYKGAYVVIAALILIFLVLNPIFFEGWNNFNSYANTLTGFALLMFSFAYFFKTYMDQKVPNLLKEPSFIIFAALLIYFAISFLVIATYSLSLLQEYSVLTKVYILKNIVNTIRNGLFGYALWMNRK